MDLTVQEMIKAMNQWADEYDMASVQINSDGNCILRLGNNRSEHLTPEQFAEWCERYRDGL